MGKRILAIVAAVLLALVGAVLVLLYAARADERAIADQSPETVFVTAERIPAGTTLREAQRTNLLTETRVPAASKPTGALESVDGGIASLVALTDLPPGQIVMTAAFGQTPEGVKRVNVPSGQLAVSVELSDPARVGTFVTPGSRITVFATYGLKSLEDSEEADHINELDLKETAVWLPDVEVLAMGEQSLTPAPQGEDGTSQQSQVPSYLVTVAVTPEDATKLIHGINNYTLYLGLRGDELNLTDVYFGDVDRDRIPE